MIIKNFIKIIYVILISFFLCSCHHGEPLEALQEFIDHLNLQKSLSVTPLPDFISSLQEISASIEKNNSSKNNWPSKQLIFANYGIKDLIFLRVSRKF